MIQTASQRVKAAIRTALTAVALAMGCVPVALFAQEGDTASVVISEGEYLEERKEIKLDFEALSYKIKLQDLDEFVPPDTLRITESQGRYPLTDYLQYYEQPKSEAGMIDLSTFLVDLGKVRSEIEKNGYWSGDTVAVMQNLDGAPYFGYSSSTYWFRFTISNSAPRQNQFTLEIENPFLDNVEVYQKIENVAWEVQEAGDSQIFDKREIKHRLFLFTLDAPANQVSTFYVKVKTSGSTYVPMNLWKRAAFEGENDGLQLLFGFLYGFVVLMMFDNFFQFVSLRSRWHLYYIFYILSALLFVTMLNGHAYEYLWAPIANLLSGLFASLGAGEGTVEYLEEFQVWMQNSLLPLLIMSMGFWSSKYGMHFLEARKYAPLMTRFITVFNGVTQVALGLMALVLLLPAFSFLGTWVETFDKIQQQYQTSIAIFFAITNIALVLAVSAFSFLRGLVIAKYFVAGFAVFIISLIFWSIRPFDIIPVSNDSFFLRFLAQNSANVGSSLQVMLLAFAMGAKMAELREEEEKARQENLKMQKEARERLEQRVKERTQELEEKALELERANENVRVLSELGREVTTSLHLEDTFRLLYMRLQTLMDATVFGIDVFDEDKQMLEFKFLIEHGQPIKGPKVPIEEESLSTYVVRNKEEVFINDIEKEYNKYVDGDISVVVGEVSQSIIYEPLIVGEAVKGAITVQSFDKNAYTDQHRQILRTLASYVAISLDHSVAYEKVELANNNIQKSINYAKRIQESILARKENVVRYFRDAFVLFRPRDVVSGDFYWFGHFDDKLIIAAVDCTGHGVPGSIMTMMGNDLLNSIINDNRMTSPAEILYELDRRLMNTLHFKESVESNVKDGMDVSLCVIETSTGTLKFAGAKNPLFYYRVGSNGTSDFMEIKGSKYSIGGNKLKKAKTFEEHEIKYQPNDIFYIFSDGYQDQFNDRGKKFLKKNFRQLLTDIHRQPFDEQHQLLHHRIDQFRGRERQMDDILVIGMKL